MKRLFRFGASCALALASSLAFAPPPAVADGGDTSLTNLIALVSQRLALAEPVARFKWANHQAITDTPRENALLAEVERRRTPARVWRARIHPRPKPELSGRAPMPRAAPFFD